MLTGLLLSTALPACALLPIKHVEVEKPVPVAVPIKDTPPAELLRCAERPEGVPEDKTLIAQIPTRARAGIIRMARALGANADQLDRLVNWNSPGTCPKGAAR